MSQSDSGIGILELAKQAGARKSNLKKLVLQCIQERGEATEDCRAERQVSLRKMTLELRPRSTPVHTDVPLSAPLEARMSGLEDAFHQMAQTLTERLDLLSVDRAVDPTAAALLEVVDGLSAKLAAVDQKTDVLRLDLRNLDINANHISGQVKGIDQIFASLGRDANKLSHTIEALSSEFHKSQVRFHEIETGFERVLKIVEALPSPSAEVHTDAEQEATAKVLASLTKLVEGMRASQVQRQVGKGVKPA